MRGFGSPARSWTPPPPRGVQLYAPNQAIFLRTSWAGQANLIVESNTGGANDGEVIVNYGFQNLSDRKLKTDVEPATLEELQEVFDTVMPQWYRRTEGNQKRTLGFIAGRAGDGRCGQGAVRADNGEERGDLVTLDYSRLACFL